VLAAANMRKESRGIHRRSDFPLEDGSQAGRIIVSGLDRVSAVRETELLDDVSERAI
jgi:succinate dehydrogenase/fumarate reductase flavoprotein subunit